METIHETETALWSWTASFGTSPVGTEVQEWDWNEDDDGYRYKSFFTIIPMEDVVEVETLRGEGGTATLRGILLDAQPEDVVMLTVQYGEDFMAMGWRRYSEALAELKEFTAMVI